MPTQMQIAGSVPKSQRWDSPTLKLDYLSLKQALFQWKTMLVEKTVIEWTHLTAQTVQPQGVKTEDRIKKNIFKVNLDSKPMVYISKLTNPKTLQLLALKMHQNLTKSKNTFFPSCCLCITLLTYTWFSWHFYI